MNVTLTVIVNMNVIIVFMIVIMTVIAFLIVIVSYLGAPTSWLGTANVGSDCSMKLIKSKVSRGTD